MQDDWNAFLKWFESFKGRLPRNLNLEAWFAAVEKSHVDLRRQIGGLRLESEFELEEKAAKAPESASPIVDRITQLMPWYRSTYNLPPDSIFYPLTSGIKTSKHILFYAKNILHWLPDSNGYRELERLVGKMGEQWAMSKVIKQTVFVNTTTTAKGFVVLGHYGCDQGSCFANSGCHSEDKYRLAKREDSFVTIIKSSRGRVEEPIRSAATMSRCWGWADPQRGIVNFVNAYTRRNTLTEGNLTSALHKQAAAILKVPEKELSLAQGLVIYGVNRPVIYLNTNATKWTFYTGNERPVAQIL